MPTKNTTGYGWDNVQRRTVLPSQAEGYLAAREAPPSVHDANGIKRKIKVRYPAQCRTCGAQLAVGKDAFWYGKGRLTCLVCDSAAERGGRQKRRAEKRHWRRRSIFNRRLA